MMVLCCKQKTAYEFRMSDWSSDVCSSDLLRRALRNLIDNAVAYGVRARLSVAVGDGEARVIVSDDGPGLSAEQIRDLIEPFARGEESRNRATGGVGLGLSHAREIDRPRPPPPVDRESTRLTSRHQCASR